MAIKMTCRVRFSAPGAAKDVIQLEKGDQSPGLHRLARAILDAARVATQDAPAVASLEEGLARVAAGRLAVETLRITMRVGAGSAGKADSRGWVLRVDGRDVEIDPDAGSKVTRRLDERSVRDFARAFAENRFATLPINLATREYVDVTVAVLGQEHGVQAGRFAVSSAPEIESRFDRAIAPLLALRH
jgi:hypothetical protein